MAETAQSGHRRTVKRGLFRFSLIYLALYSVTVARAWISELLLSGSWGPPWRAFPEWVASHVLDLTAAFVNNGSSDTAYHYVEALSLLVLTAVTTAALPVFTSRGERLSRVKESLTVFVRYTLAFSLIIYGTAKVLNVQFPAPSPVRLAQPFGDASPMGLLWTFMGASASYTFFVGAAELAAGFLLTMRRTALLGSVLAAVVLTNIVALNLSYDVPVKLYSLHLLLMAVFLILISSQLNGLWKALLLPESVEPGGSGPRFRNPRGVLAVSVFRSGLVVGVFALIAFRFLEVRAERRAARASVQAVDTRDHLLTSRGFRWISEAPLNR